MISQKMSCQTCMTNGDLCQRIAAFADCNDLLVLELVSRQWQTVVQTQFRIVRNSKEYKNLGFKAHDLYFTDKRMCCRISNQRKRGTSRICVVGGSFGSLYTDNCMIEDRTDKLRGRVCSQLDIPIKLGSTASTYDSSGNILMIGGWDDNEEVILDTVYHFDVHGEYGWRKRNPINQPRCFGAAERTIQGDILFFAGGSSPYRGAECYTDCYIRKRNSARWSESIVPSMQHARCGHSAVTLFNDSILVAGGYAGGFDYLSSVELLDPGLDRWTSLPAMSVPRSGMAAVLGPSGEVYVAGGSPDGTTGHRSLERFDLREGKWQTLASMHLGRGYTAGCVSTWDSFFVSGGTHNMKFQGGMECYDFRSGEWNLLVEQDVASTFNNLPNPAEWQQLMDHLQPSDDSDDSGSDGDDDSDSGAGDEESVDEDEHISNVDAEEDSQAGSAHEMNQELAQGEESGEDFEEVSMSDEEGSSNHDKDSDASDASGSGSDDENHSYLAAAAHHLLHEDVPLLEGSSEDGSESGGESGAESNDGNGDSQSEDASHHAGFEAFMDGEAVPGSSDMKDVHLLRGCHQMMFLL